MTPTSPLLGRALHSLLVKLPSRLAEERQERFVPPESVGAPDRSPSFPESERQDGHSSVALGHPYVNWRQRVLASRGLRQSSRDLVRREAVSPSLAGICILLTIVMAGSLLLGQPRPDRSEAPVPYGVQMEGHGSPMILIPGLASSGDVWEDTIAHYKDRYQCHAFTLAGFAGQPPIEGPYLSTMRDALIDYIERHDLKQPIVVGHSLGGFLALSIAAIRPGLVGPLVIVDGVPFLPAIWMGGDVTSDSVASMAEMTRARYKSQTQEQYEALVRSGKTLKTMISNQDDIDRAVEWSLASDKDTIGQVMYELFSTDLRSDLAAIRSPTLVMATWVAYKDFTTRILAESRYRNQYMGLEGVQVVMFDKARHFIMWDDPDQYFKVLDDFLARM